MKHSAKIKRDTSRGLAVIADRVLDDAHMTWVAAEVESGQALRAWFDSTGPEDASTYRTYRAAFDREDAAARELQRLSQLTQPCEERVANTH